MKAITENYDVHTKEELLAEIHSRKIEGIRMATTKPDMIAALALDDESKPKEEQSQPPAPLPPLKASPIPQIAKNPVSETGIDACQMPPDEEFTDGVYVNKNDKEEYALCIHPADGYQRTHTAKNSAHTWQGTEAEFDATFKKS